MGFGGAVGEGNIAEGGRDAVLRVVGAHVWEERMISSKPAANDTYGSYYPVDPDKLSLESNFGPMEAGSVGFLQPTSAETPLDIMHERFERDGYLFVCANTFLYGNTNTLSHIGQRMYSQRSLPLPLHSNTLSPTCMRPLAQFFQSFGMLRPSGFFPSSLRPCRSPVSIGQAAGNY